MKWIGCFLLLLFPIASFAHLIRIDSTSPFPATVAASSASNATYTVVNISAIKLQGIQDQSVLPAGMQRLSSSTCNATQSLLPGRSCTVQLVLQAPSSPTTLAGTLRERAVPSLDGIEVPINVTVVPLTSITVTPTTAALDNNETQQFTATGNYASGNTKDLTSVATWASSEPTLATINSSGLATASATGSGNTNITATYEGLTSNTAVLSYTLI